MANLLHAEMLALGIGNPEELDLETLKAFFLIVQPVEFAMTQGKSLSSLRKAAFKYLRAATPTDYMRNALFMSNDKKEVAPKFIAFVKERTAVYDNKTKEAQKEVENVVKTVKKTYGLDLQECTKVAD